jgi:hypothetical protein
MELTKELRLMGGARALVRVHLTHRALGNGETVTHGRTLPYGYLRVSFTGEVAPKGVRYGTNASSYGQVTDELPARLRMTWDRWHLNGMRAGCAHLGKGSTIGDVCEVSGYKYGHAWLVEPLTMQGALDILRAMGPEHFSTWVVAHDDIAIGVFPSTTEALRYMHDTLPYSWEHAIRHEGWQVSNVIGVPELAIA